MSCIDPSVGIVTKSPKVGPLLIFSISLERANKTGNGNSPRTPASRPGPSPHWADPGPSSPTRRAWGPPQPRSWRPVQTPLHWQARWQVVSELRNQCCESGSGIRCLFDPWIRDPGWVKVRIRIRDEQPGSYFLELRNLFFGLKYSNPESGMEKIRIRDKHPGSATLCQT
jgi:hypothetical protein